jgi:hypothetical protein
MEGNVLVESYQWGHTATGLPIMGGIITPEDWMNDDEPIRHMLHLTTGDASKLFLAPAHRCDGTHDDTWIREGARIRFPHDVDLSYLGTGFVDVKARRMAEALRDYGAIITDKTNGGCAFRFRNTVSWSLEGLPTPYSFTDPTTGKYHYPNEYMWRLPWARTQVLDPSVSPE